MKKKTSIEQITEKINVKKRGEQNTVLDTTSCVAGLCTSMNLSVSDSTILPSMSILTVGASADEACLLPPVNRAREVSKLDLSRAEFMGAIEKLKGQEIINKTSDTREAKFIHR